MCEKRSAKASIPYNHSRETYSVLTLGLGLRYDGGNRKSF